MPKNEWFRSYFAEPYGEIYSQYLLPPDMARDEVDFVCDVLGLREGDAILDCPCGFGRHMAEMLPRFPGVVGLDLDWDCLSRAAQWIPGAPVVRGDMRALPLADSTFDAAINLFNSFGYFSAQQNAQALREFARVLRPGGALVIDITNPGPLVELIQEHPRTRQQVLDLVITEDWYYSPDSHMLTNETQIALSGDTIERSYRIRLYSLPEMQTLLDKAGFSLEKVFGDFDGEDYDPEESHRMIVLARRKQKES